MGAYKTPSAIQCRGTFQPVKSCQDVLDDMPAGTKAEVFAPPGNSSATVLLPQAVESGKLVDPVPIDFGFSF